METPPKIETNKSDALTEEIETRSSQLFDDKKSLETRLNSLSIQLDFLQKNNLISDKETILNNFKECLKIDDREKFTSLFLELFKPLIKIKNDHPAIFERMLREESLKTDQIKLSEVLFGEVLEKEAKIHLAPAEELIKEKGIGNFKKEINNGLIRLAEIVKQNSNIEKVSATSWIVAKNPALLENLGFSIEGEISKEEMIGDFDNEKRIVAKAVINRENFLTRYGNNQH